MELINTKNDFTIGVIEIGENEEEVYRPVIMWNLSINSYLSEKDSSYRAYGCTVRVKGKRGDIQVFKVFIKDADFSKFERVRSAIVNQTHGQLILNSRFDLSIWTDFVPKLLFDCSDTIEHQRPARNIGLQWKYFQSMAFNHGGLLQLEHVEIVYKDIVFNGLGEKLDHPVNILVPDAFPSKTFRVSDFKPSGLRGFLKLLATIHLYLKVSKRTACSGPHWCPWSTLLQTDSPFNRFMSFTDVGIIRARNPEEYCCFGWSQGSF